MSEDTIDTEAGHIFKWGERLPDGSEVWHREPIFKDFSIREKLIWILSVKQFVIERLLNPAKGSRVLEFGCGTGGLAIDISRRRDVRVIGLDIYERQSGIAQAQSAKYQARCDFLIYDGENLPFANESFDYMYSVDVFGHVPNLQRIIHELCRVVKHGAKAAIFSESKVGRWSIVQHYLSQKGVSIDDHVASHISMYSKRELIAMLEGGGICSPEDPFCFDTALYHVSRMVLRDIIAPRRFSFVEDGEFMFVPFEEMVKAIFDCYLPIIYFARDTHPGTNC